MPRQAKQNAPARGPAELKTLATVLAGLERAGELSPTACAI
jgi:hypothetical protein